MTLLKYALPIFFATSLMGCEQSTAVETTEKETKSNKPSTETSKLPADAPTYTIALDHDFPPFSFKDEYGGVTGYELDIFKAVGEEAGFKVEALPAQWEGIFDMLESGSVDVVAGAALTLERIEKYEMSDSHVDTDLVFAYTGEERSYEELVKGKISSQSHTSFIAKLRDLPEVDEDQVVAEDTSYTALTDMLTGKTDAVFNNRAILQYYLNSIQDMPKGINIQVTPLPENSEFIMAYTIKKGNTEVLNKVNEGLQVIKSNGKYDEINKKWFGETN